MKPLHSDWIPIEQAREGEPEPFVCNGVLMVMTVRFDEGVFFQRTTAMNDEELDRARAKEAERLVLARGGMFRWEAAVQEAARLARENWHE